MRFLDDIGILAQAISCSRHLLLVRSVPGFVVFVVLFVSHDRPWARTGSGSSRTTSQRHCGGPFYGVHARRRAVHPRSPREVISSSFEARERQGSTQRGWWVFFQRWSKFRGTKSAPESGRAVEGSPVRVAQLEVALLALGEEDPARPMQDRVAQTEAFLVGHQGVGGQDPRRGTSIGCLACRSQGATESFHCHQRSSRGDSSTTIEVHKLEASQGGDCIQEEFLTKRPKTLAVSFLDLVPLGDGRLRGSVDEAVRVVVGARDSTGCAEFEWVRRAIQDHQSDREHSC